VRRYKTVGEQLAFLEREFSQTIARLDTATGLLETYADGGHPTDDTLVFLDRPGRLDSAPAQPAPTPLERTAALAAGTESRRPSVADNRTDALTGMQFTVRDGAAYQMRDGLLSDVRDLLAAHGLHIVTEAERKVLEAMHAIPSDDIELALDLRDGMSGRERRAWKAELARRGGTNG
jgi:hypothetical protein